MSSTVLAGIAKKLDVNESLMPDTVATGGVVVRGKLIAIHEGLGRVYMCVKMGKPILQSMVLGELIKGRTKAKTEGRMDAASGYKALTFLFKKYYIFFSSIYINYRNLLLLHYIRKDCSIKLGF